MVRAVLLIFFCLFSSFGWSQMVYTSPYTQHWPTIFNTEIEEINRSISFEENSITLATETKAGKEIEIFYIQKIDRENGSLEFLCLTSDNKKVTIAIPPQQDQVRVIDIYRPSRKTGEEVQLRLHINN